MKKKFIKTPLKGVYVHGAKDVGTRTVNLLMGEHAGEYVRGDIMDANAVIQAFDELKGNVDNNHDSLEEIVNEIHNFRDTTNHRFDVFQEKAEEETANRIQGDNTLDNKIDQKDRESKERDNVLQQNIDTENHERVNADTQLRNDLTAEVNRAKANENALSSDIQAEATKRENDDNTIKDNLNAEVTRATAKENEIKAEVDVINGDSTTEGSFRKAIADVVGAAPEAYDTLKEIADKLNSNDDLHTAINDAIATKATTVALNEEITRAKAAEAENKAEIAAEAARAKEVEGDNALAIQNEESRATTAETAINESLNTEIDRAKGQEAYLQNLVNTKADTTAFDSAKADLDKKISDETTRATSEEDELRSLITTEQNRATASESSIADDLNGKLAQKADTTALNNYVLTTALNEQVDTLNTAISAKVDSTAFNQGLSGAYNDLNNKITNNAQTINQNINSVASGLSGQITANKKSIDSNKKSIDSFHGEFTSYQDYTNQQINGLNQEIAKKQEKGNYIPYEIGLSADYYKITDGLEIETSNHIGGGGETVVYISGNGIHFKDKSANQIPTANWDFININDYALKTELPTVPTKVSQLTNDSNFITAADVDFTPYATTEALTAVEQKVTANTTAITNVTTSRGIPYDSTDTKYYKIDRGLRITDSGLTGIITSYGIDLCENGIGPGTFKVHPVQGITQTTPYFDFSLNNEGLSETIKNGGSKFKISPSQVLLQKDDTNFVKTSLDGMQLQKDGSDIIKVNQISLQYNDHLGNNLRVGETSSGLFEIQMTSQSGRMASFFDSGFYIKDGIGADRNGIYNNPGELNFNYVYNKSENSINVGTFNGRQFIDQEGNLRDDIKKVEQEISAKQNKITPIEVNVADIGTASIEQLRTIVSNLINALSSIGLITTVETA